MELIECIKSALTYLKNFITNVINRVLSFAKDVIKWFKGLFLDPKKDVPFIANTEKLKTLIKNAPVKDFGIFNGVYDEEKDEITHAEVINAKGFDKTTRETLGDNAVVVLN